MDDNLDLTSSGTDLETGQSSDQPLEDQPGYVTREELLGEVSQLRTELQRYSQSMTDKASNRWGEQLKRQEQALLERVQQARAAGVEITDAEVMTQRQRLRERALSGELDTGPDQPAQVELTPDHYRMQARVLAAQGRVAEAMAEAGVTLSDSDPEVRLINAYAADPETWERSVYQALQRKASRLGKSFQVPAQRQGQGAPPQARLPGGGGGTGIAPSTLESKTRELQKLQNKSGKTEAEWRRMDELEAEITSSLR